MKKILLGSSALVVAAALAAPASAADKISLGLGGFLNTNIATIDTDGQNSENPFVFRQNAEIHFKGKTTLDNGLQVGARLELEGTDNDSSGANTFDEIVAYVQGGFGQVLFGEEDGPAFFGLNTPMLGVDVAAVGYGTPGITNQSGSNFSPIGTTANPDSDAFKIIYYTPRFNGIQLGASFAPQNSANLNDRPQDQSVTGSLQDVIQLSASYKGMVGGLDLGLAAQGFTSDNDAGNGDASGWSAQAQLGFSGFSVVAGIVNCDDSTCGAASAGAEREIWFLGGSYATGPWTFVAQYGNKEDSASGTTTSDQTNWGVGVNYALGPGIKTSLAYMHGEEDVGSTSGDMLSLGFGISF